LRNRLVDYFRIRLSEIYPQDHLERVRKPFEKEWNDLVSNANLSRQQGGTATKIRDDYDFLSVGHFYSLFDVYYDKLFSSAVLAAGNYRKPVKAKLLGNLKAIKDSRDPLSHPVSEEISFEEGFAILSDVKQVLESLGFSNDSEQISDLMRELQGFDTHEASRAICSLPTQDSIYLDFVGRRTVLDHLRELFSNRSNKRCLLAGDGGKGKSAVAYRFAQDISQMESQFKLIAWLSAKRRKFEEGKVVYIDAPDFTDLDSALDRILAHYGMLTESVEGEEKKSRVLQLLNDFPAFLVIDDIDTVLSDTEVVALFTFDIPSTQSVVLLTSRREIPGIKKFDISGFELTETEEFIQSRIELYGLDPKVFSSSLTSELQRVTDGSPLYLDDLMRLARIVPIQKAIGMWSDKQGDEARKYALQRELEQLSADSRKVLICASLGDDPVSFAEIESILNISEDRVLAALNELQTLFLFPKPRVVEGEQRFEVNGNTRKLVRMVESTTDQYARIESRAKAIRGNLPHVGRGTISALIRQGFLLQNSGKYQEAEQLLIKAAEKYPQAADLQGFMGYFYRRLDRFTDASKHFESAYKLKSESRDTYRHWVKMEMSRKEWTNAISAADKGLKMIPHFYELHALRAESKLRSGHDLSSRLQREKAHRLWNEAIKDILSAKKSPDALLQGERQFNCQLYNTLIVCLDLVGDYKNLYAHFLLWHAEHPDDHNVGYQNEFIEKKYGMSLEKLSWQRPRIETSSRSRTSS
jgi:tetratricopeptide (TPR) repeat protein